MFNSAARGASSGLDQPITNMGTVNPAFLNFIA